MTEDVRARKDEFKGAKDQYFQDVKKGYKELSDAITRLASEYKHGKYKRLDPNERPDDGLPRLNRTWTAIDGEVVATDEQFKEHTQTLNRVLDGWLFIITSRTRS